MRERLSKTDTWLVHYALFQVVTDAPANEMASPGFSTDPEPLLAPVA